VHEGTTRHAVDTLRGAGRRRFGGGQKTPTHKSQIHLTLESRSVENKPHNSLNHIEISSPFEQTDTLHSQLRQFNEHRSKDGSPPTLSMIVPANENYVQPRLGDATEWLNALCDGRQASVAWHMSGDRTGKPAGGCSIRGNAHSELQMSIPLLCLHTQSSQQLLVLLARM
jgi:hypothetical protein